MGNKGNFNKKFSKDKKFGRENREEFSRFKPRNKFSSFEKFIADEKGEQLEIKDINQDFFNKNVQVSGIIQKITQTGGPTIFTISDGTGILALKGFVGKGERAYPEINEKDAIKATVTINEYNKELEGEIKKIAKLSPEENKEFARKIIEVQKKRAEIKPLPFLVKSEILEKLKPAILKAAFEIRLAIIQNRPIIIRHHNDTDGYSAGFALEKAIIPLIEKEHGSEKASYEYFKLME